MPVRLTDAEIQSFLEETKPLPFDYPSRLRLKSKTGHKEVELLLAGVSGTAFVVKVRQSNVDPLDFSVILGCLLPPTNALFRLRRYNGRSHEHTNRIEQQTFYGFHVHHATERYQGLDGMDEDAFAEPTTSYVDVQGAISCLILDCGFEGQQSQLPMF